jgi:hypothetical protein
MFGPVQYFIDTWVMLLQNTKIHKICVAVHASVCVYVLGDG